jgi:hypothetical protein
MGHVFTGGAFSCSSRMCRFVIGPIAFAGIACSQQASPAVDPFTTDQRIQYFVRRTFSWERMTLLGADTAASYLTGGSSRWGSGAPGFASRYGDSFGRRILRNSMELGLGMALREDARYKPSAESGIRKRLRYATLHALTATVPDGTTRLAYSRIAAGFGAEFISSRWTPERGPRGEWALNAAWCLLDRFPNSYLSEFSPDLTRFGKRVVRKIGFRRKTADAKQP